MSMDDDSLEDAAGMAAAEAYQNYLLRKVAVMLLSVAALVVLTAGDWTWGILALWHLPRLAAACLAGFMAGELTILIWRLARRSRNRQPKPAGLTDGDKMTAALDSLAARRDEPYPLSWWRAGVRARIFWQALVLRSVYSSCCGLVVASYAGTPAGIGAALAWTALCAVFGQRSRAAAAGTVRAAAFADSRPPRDSPEM